MKTVRKVRTGEPQVSLGWLLKSKATVKKLSETARRKGRES